MGAIPQPGSGPKSRASRIPRLALPAPVRIGLFLLLAAALIGLWRPLPASPGALAAAGAYLRETYKGYEMQAPSTQGWLFGQRVLVYGTLHYGSPSRVVVVLSEADGQWQVTDARLVIGGPEGRRMATWLLSLISTIGMLYLVFFVSVPRTFGRKCPRDLSLLAVSETVVMPGQVHKSGLGLAPIIERVWSCRQCDFRHHEALLDPLYRPTLPAATMVAKPSPWYDVDALAEKWDRIRMERAITDEQYEQMLIDAKAAARAKSSSDSPWLYRT